MSTNRSRPNGHVQFILSNRLIEWDLRAEWEDAERGEVLAAAYLYRPSFLSRWFLGRPELSLRPPFGPEGQDALGLWRSPPGVGIEHVIGQAGHLLGNSDFLFIDLWVDHRRPWRLSQGYDFALAADPGDLPRRQVVVSCGLAPLILARPIRCRVEEVLEALDPRVRSFLPDDLHGNEGWVVRIQPGDRVEALGVPRPMSQSARFNILAQQGDPYRGLVLPEVVVGDEDGLRLMLRVIEQ